ncbi:MAG: DUF2505 family protein [Deltaproteobacteria bacterium]|jgi:hypothetical protein|nr:DUF2505 family protein [Deltaproteobacteria bacterium]
MKYKIVDKFKYDLELVKKGMFHQDLINYLQENMESVKEIEVIDYQESSEGFTRKVRYLPKPVIKKIGPKKIPPEAMEWVEISTWNEKENTLEFSNIPTHPKVKKLFENYGKIELIPGQNGVERVMTGAVNVKVRFFGKIAEKVITSKAKKILQEETKVLSRFIEERLTGKNEKK